MKKILLSLGLVTTMAVVIGVGATGAFFSDTESSTGNTFTAGAIDLKVDNESYYNGNVCVENPNGGQNEPYFIWQGSQPFPVPGTECTTSFEPSDLDEGLLFLNFTDLKPDDEGEDTISLHVNNNDAYLCMDMSLTSDDDISSNEPELDTGDDPEDNNDTWDGELGGLVKMVWWVDDGDNILEEGETLLNGGVKTIKDFFGEDDEFSADLADATTNVWEGPNGSGPILGDTTYYIAKAFCYGDMTLSPLTQDGGDQGASPNGPNGPGWSCEGKTLGNESQTDGVTMDIGFRAMQARHNPNYTCENETPTTAKLTVYKNIVNDNGGNNVIGDYQLQVVGTVVTNVTSGVQTTFVADSYTVTETGISGYQASFSGDCNAAGQITLNPGDVKSCTITNNDIAPNITLIKSVINDDGGSAVPANFTMKIDGNVVPQNTSVAVSANSGHTIDESALSGYHFVSISGTGCPAATSSPVVLDEGEAITCTITNDDNGGGGGGGEGEAVTLWSDSFGTGNSENDIPNWEEEGDDSDSSTKAQENHNSGQDSFSPDDGDDTGRFARIGKGEWVCRSVVGTGHNTLGLKYFWRGDNDAENDSDTGVVEYFTGGTCDSPTGLATLATHELDDDPAGGEVWSSLQSIDLGSLDGTSFTLRFRNSASASNEDFRVDGVSVTGIPD